MSFRRKNNRLRLGKVQKLIDELLCMENGTYLSLETQERILSLGEGIDPRRKRGEAANELKNIEPISKLLSPSKLPYSLKELKVIYKRSRVGSDLYYKVKGLLARNAPRRVRFELPRFSFEDLGYMSSFLYEGSTLYFKTQYNKLLQIRAAKLLKVPKYFSDLTEEQLIPLFCQYRKFRFVLCKVFLSYKDDDAKDSPCSVKRVSHTLKMYTYDLPKGTAHCKVVGSGHKLFGSIQAAAFSLDPASTPFNIFKHKFNDPIVVHKLGCLYPHSICYCSIPFSTSVKIAARLHVTTDNMVDMNTLRDYDHYFSGAPEQYNEVFEICNDSAVISFSDYFAKRPNGGSGSCTLKGRDGYLKLYYVALKYVVDAALEVVFATNSEETKVAGRVMAYYGKKFDYGCSPAEVDDYKAMLFETEQPEVKPGKINLMQSVLSVPAQFSLIIDANLSDSTSGAIILSGVYEFFVPTDGRISVGCIEGNGCSLELTVDWKLPPFAEKTTLAKGSYYSDLTKKQLFYQRISVRYGRWSLQKEFSLTFGCFLKAHFPRKEGEVAVCISTGTIADDCDYLCTSVLNIWPEIRSISYLKGPKSAALHVRDSIALLPPTAGMLERCIVGGPGFLKFKLSRTWIAKSIFKMLEHGISIWAPEVPMEKAIIDFLPRDIAKEMHMDHLRSTIIGETLARVLEFSGVDVHRRFRYGDYLDNKSKMMMTEFLVDRFPDGIVNDQAIGALEVLYEKSKKRFVEDADFRERTQPVQVWDQNHRIAWERICNISRKHYQKVYQRLGVCVKEEGKILHDFYIKETLDLLRKKGYNTNCEGDEAIVIEGQKLPLVDFAALWHALEIEKADRIVHVADVGQRDKIEMCITAAESVGWSVTNHCHDPLSYVGFGLLQVKDVKGSDLDQLLVEAKSRCKGFFGKADKKLEHTAEALGYGAVKYEVLKNNRLTDYTFSFDDMLKKTGKTVVYLQHTHARICLDIRISTKKFLEFMENTSTLEDSLTLKDDIERELGLHLLRFTEVLGEVSRVLAPHILCDYLFVLCKKFNRVYSESWQEVQSGEDSKILLCEATRMVIGLCFYFFGITPIYKKI